MSDHTLVLPKLLGSRRQVQSLIEGAPGGSAKVLIDCRDLEAVAPSAADELAKTVIEREWQPTLVRTPRRLVALFLRSLENRRVAGTLTVKVEARP